MPSRKKPKQTASDDEQEKGFRGFRKGSCAESIAKVIFSKRLSQRLGDDYEDCATLVITEVVMASKKYGAKWNIRLCRKIARNVRQKYLEERFKDKNPPVYDVGGRLVKDDEEEPLREPLQSLDAPVEEGGETPQVELLPSSGPASDESMREQEWHLIQKGMRIQADLAFSGLEQKVAYAVLDALRSDEDFDLAEFCRIHHEPESSVRAALKRVREAWREAGWTETLLNRR